VTATVSLFCSVTHDGRPATLDEARGLVALIGGGETEREDDGFFTAELPAGLARALDEQGDLTVAAGDYCLEAEMP
jgi:hypothetical protein